MVGPWGQASSAVGQLISAACSLPTSSKDVLPCRLTDSDHRGVFELALDRDGIEALSQVLCSADKLHLVAPPNVFLDDVGCCKDAMARLPKDLRELRVIQLTDDLGFYVLRNEPLL